VAAVGAIGALVAIQGLRFERQVEREARGLLSQAGGGTPDLAPLDALPAPVRRYLEVSGAARRAPIRTARLRHGGTFVTGPGEPPMAIRGVQWFTADPPGFVWWGRIRIAPGVWIDGRDRAVGGEGNMLVRAASTVTLADARGPELDQGALLRLLGEAFWLPVRFTAQRYRDAGGRSVLTEFAGDSSDFREVDGVKVPFRVGATWDLESGPLRYAAWQVEQVELDRREP
jgi:hypothetical protein